MPKLLVVESGLEEYRRYILESLREQGYQITLLSAQAPTWQADLIEGAIVADLADFPSTLAAVRAHAGAPFSGLFTYIETCIPLTAFLCARLGFPFLPERDAKAVRDKGLMREKLRAAGLAVPEVERYAGDLASIVRRLGLPVVIKPVRGFSSMNVVKLERTEDVVDAEASIRGWLAGMNPLLGDGFLIEQYIEGPEFSVESAVERGPHPRVRHSHVTDKAKGPEPFFEEIGQCVPAAIGAGLRERLLAVAEAGIRALGIESSIAHTELRVSPSLGPVIMEIGARLAGDGIPLLARHATGVDLVRAAAELALGRPAVLAHSRAGAAAIFYFSPKRRQTVRAGIPRAPGIEGLVEFRFEARAGQEVAPPPGAFFTRLGHGVIRAETPERCKELGAELLRRVEEQCGVELMAMDWAVSPR
jgi:biotin carboxylase